MDIYKKMAELGISLPDAPVSGGNYSLVIREGRFLFTSGQTPKKNGTLVQKGKVGTEVTEEEGYQLARLCTLNALSAMEQELGNLNRVVQIIKATVFVSSTASFTGQARVANGATDLLVSVFGPEHGRPARSAVGVAVLPGDAPCEVELIASCTEE